MKAKRIQFVKAVAKKKQPSPKQKVRSAITTLNRAIVATLRAGAYPELEILGEADSWPEVRVAKWSEFPKEDKEGSQEEE